MFSTVTRRLRVYLTASSGAEANVEESDPDHMLAKTRNGVHVDYPD